MPFPSFALPISPALVASASTVSYAETLSRAITLMEQERHKDALKPMKEAVTQDRNEPLGAITLGTLYLHTGSTERAAQAFALARRRAPHDSLAILGAALAELAAGRTTNAAATLAAVDNDAVPSAPLLRDYIRLVSGDATSLTARYAAVDKDEPNPLRLELAGFIALKAKNSARGEELLRAFVALPAYARLQESSALVLPFDSDLPAQGCAGTLPSAIGFPEAPKGVRPLSGRVSLLPPEGLFSQAIGYVSYTIDGGFFSASTNYPPFTTDWNTERIPNGEYTLRTQAFDRSQRLLKETVRTVTIANASSPTGTSRFTDDERSDIRRRLLALLTPRPCRKAAHFALAERAVARGDSANALKHVESVVAIDPTFHNARESLRQFNRQIAGPCEGMWKGQTTEKLVALTFDDGPNPLPQRTPALLDALKSVNAPGTFFIVGMMAERSPDLIKRMVAEGHEIGNHSYSHPNLTYLSPVAIERELCRTSCIVRDITGVRPRFYRPPGGNFNTATVDTARALGMAGAYWTVDAIRLETAPLPPENVTKYVLQNVSPGCIVLLHNAPDNTVASVVDMVKALRKSGYKLVTMSELVRRSKPIVKVAGTPKHATIFDADR